MSGLKKTEDWWSIDGFIPKQSDVDVEIFLGKDTSFSDSMTLSACGGVSKSNHSLFVWQTGAC